MPYFGYEVGHQFNSVHSSFWRAAMRLAAKGSDFTPDSAAMSQADIIGIEWLSNNDVVSMTGRDKSSFDKQAHTGVAIARTFFINHAALLDGALQIQPGSPDGLNGVDLGRDASFHVRGSPSEDTSSAHFASKGRGRPTWANGNDIHVPIKMKDR